MNQYTVVLLDGILFRKRSLGFSADSVEAGVAELRAAGRIGMNESVESSSTTPWYGRSILAGVYRLWRYEQEMLEAMRRHVLKQLPR